MEFKEKTSPQKEKSDMTDEERLALAAKAEKRKLQRKVSGI
jgi:hypothetical protein